MLHRPAATSSSSLFPVSSHMTVCRGWNDSGYSDGLHNDHVCERISQLLERLRIFGELYYPDVSTNQLSLSVLFTVH
jgi:hypothetical protein